MTEYYSPTKKVSKTVDQIKSENPTIGFPGIINNECLEPLGYFPVFSSAIPTPTDNTKVVIRNGVELKDGKYVEVWAEQDRHSGTDKSTKDAEYTTALNAGLASNARSERDRLLLETDWWALTENSTTYSDARKKYRADLRALTEQADFPSKVTYPVKPS
tara:strand:- start:76 stop:555 length:480 start_codon:yes stop_codon:yes gene_type:complete